MANFEINDPKANQILVYDEISSAFINVDDVATTNVGGLNIGSSGVNIFHDVSGNNLRFKSITSDGSLTLTENNTHIEISFDGNASSLDGYSAMDFLIRTNDLSDVNPSNARGNLSIYSVDECHDEFMESNASNIPDVDNVYDLGSNGRRYADIYAKTFHGDATNALFAEQLSRNGALDKQILTWSDASQRWIPTSPKSFTITGADDVHTPDLRDRSILRFNANNNRWEPIVFDTGNGGNNIADIENLGNGLGVFKNRTGFVANYRSLSAGSNIELRYNFNDDEIVIDADVPQTTNQLPEGNSNLYYTTSRFDTRFSNSSVRGLRDVQSGTPSINQTLVWNGSEFTFRTIIVDVSNTDDIPEGTNNLYYTQQRVQDTVDSYFQNNGFALTNISDVNATHVNGNVLYSQSGSWINKKLDISDLNNMNLGMLSDGDTIVWQGDNSEFIKTKLPTSLIDLDGDAQSEHFNNTSFNAKIGNITTDSINEGTNNLYLTEPSLINALNNISINELSNVNLVGVSDGDTLIWNNSSSEFVTIKAPVNLIDLGGTTQSEHFTTTSFMAKVGNINTDDITEGTTNLYFTTNRFDDRFNTSSILDLVDINGVNISDGDVLSWDATNSEFISVNVESITSDISELSDLNDVNINSNDMNDGDILEWSSTGSTFIRGVQKDRLSELNDVNFSALSSNDTLVYNGSNFINRQMLPFSLNSPSNGQILTWSGSEFVNVDPSTLGTVSINLDEIDNVVIDYSSINTGDALLWDNSLNQFTVGDISQFIDIRDLNGINVNGISTGDTIRWNGSSFINSPLPRFTNDLPNPQDVLVFDTTANAYVNRNRWSLLNVNYSSPVDKSLFVFNETSGLFDVERISLNDLSNIDDTVSKTDGTNYVFMWNELSQELLVNPIDISTLDGINIDGIQNGQMLKWDTSTNTFINHTAVLSDFEGVSLSNLQEDQILYWNGTEFTNGNPDIDINTITEINVSPNILNGEVLMWDEGNGHFRNSDVITDVALNSVDYTTITPSSNNISPRSALYQLLTPNVDTAYNLSTINLGNNKAYEFKMVLSNVDNYVVSFASNGNIEYIGGIPANFDGKCIITAVTFDGIDWIFDVSEAIV